MSLYLCDFLPKIFQIRSLKIAYSLIVMARSGSRYGTFIESLESSRTELISFDVGIRPERETVSEINLSYALGTLHDQHQDHLIRNRLPFMYERTLHWLSDKGNLGIIITLHVGIIGLFMLSVTEVHTFWRIFAQYLVSCGMFGVVGGFLNWIALNILFVKVPGIYGSGVFAKCHLEITRSIMKIFLDTFLEKSFLDHYVEQKLGRHIVEFNVERRLRQILETETVEQIINRELHSFSQSSEGQLLLLVGVRAAAIKPLIRPFIMDIVSEIIPDLIENLYYDSKSATATTLKQEVIQYLTQGNIKVSEDQVTKFVRTLIYRHLNWIIITGCIVGFFMGIVSQLTSIARII